MSYNVTILTDYIFGYSTCICNLCMYVCGCESVCWYKWACRIVVPHTYVYIYIYREREGGDGVHQDYIQQYIKANFLCNRTKLTVIYMAQLIIVENTI